MIADLRIYTCKPGRTGDFVAIYKELAWPVQQKYLGRCLGWFTSIEGSLNTVVHIWGFDSQADREARRAAMAKDPGFKIYLDALKAADVLVSMENRIVTPTDFSPVQ